MAAPTRAASAPRAPATGAFLKAAPERLDEAVGVEVEGATKGAPPEMKTMGGVTVSIQG